ncbi:Phosphoprotein involved in cytoplasm to vacuole targeting and autophagy [Plasmopara halstedii]|uniref:Phosphoprotein involved in cytoplasm to vacuole targeting and autophagy n=1 Tax=Plasmopara halstedii TaxID=4781 RepID=A0A0P1AZW3_PLAHL|nr:Phosphoprotein involved in cytoplasm to vacuole targeting and autophagy [Plasmopara halstedii]CEG47013.1 Phosphoprotein involved in cytoplasm to vacuole targeting and autophagy [Plasmopara halstedii]|eukprot:XP_024583382.1 Phosphoprotein involved in cytoplasm to vacuole targeting and autophagy [Plasmopara halstedii]
MHYTAPPPRSSTGRTKTEQVVLEFLYKAAELIVQSRVNFHTEPDLRRGSRRARFNLDIEEVQVVRDAMTAWKKDVTLPLAIDIFWDAGSHKVLLERWSVTFAVDEESSTAHMSSTHDVIQQLKEVCKRISVLLRALFSFMRQLPAHRLFTQSYPSMLSYTMHATPTSEAMRVAFETQHVATSGYSFIPIVTPFGVLKVAAVYRRDCDQFTQKQGLVAPSRILQDNFIIQDYVPEFPDLASASAPVTSAAMKNPPLRNMNSHTGSFVPVSDAEILSEDIKTQHRRSSPLSIPASAQQQSSTDDSNDSQRDDELQTQIGMSKPMAIPRVSSKGGIAVAANRDMDAVIKHAHSYGGENELRLRNSVTNPNVAAAPYGYGNVTIERDHERSSSPSLAFQHRQQLLWEGHGDRHDNATELHSSQRSSDDGIHLDTSTSTAAYHCMPTPPRHPKTVASLRHNSPALMRKLSSEHNPATGSFERFSLDSGSSPQLQQQSVPRRKTSFSGAFISDSFESISFTTLAGGIERSQQSENNKSATIAATEATAISMNLRTMPHAPAENLTAVTVSPPFQANPSELLSVSPGYVYTKSQLRSNSSNLPTFVTTDRFQRAVYDKKNSSPARIVAIEHRNFSPDFGNSGVTTWGFSPDTPDSFGFALSSDSSSSVRPSFSHGSADEIEDQHGDLDPLNLPFVISDGLSSATTTVDSVSTEHGSTLSPSLNTASVGNFLHQLKNAPRLSKSLSTLAPLNSPGKTGKVFDTKHEAALASMFDDELANYRNLRDELARLL